MNLSRRFLPSISLLQAFEVAARSGSFTMAAQELNLTQSAISRQIKALEEQLEVCLFTRERQQIQLTDAGAEYAHHVREALELIATASRNIHSNPSGGTLNLGILPMFGSRWLAPRLPGFLANNPDIHVNLVTQLEPFDFKQEKLDAAIHFGKERWPGAHCKFLMDEHVIPVCSPTMQRSQQFETPADLLQVPLLHLSSRSEAWARWFNLHNVRFNGNHTSMLLDQFSTITQLAKSGIGIGLLPEFLIQEELERGSLVPAWPHSTQSEESYYLVWPKHRSSYPPLVSFYEWMQQQTTEMHEPPSSEAMQLA